MAELSRELMEKYIALSQNDPTQDDVDRFLASLSVDKAIALSGFIEDELPLAAGVILQYAGLYMQGKDFDDKEMLAQLPDNVRKMVMMVARAQDDHA